MNYMSKIAEMLGVEINEEFKVRSTKYTQNVNSEIFVFTKVGITTDDGITRNDILIDLLLGVLEIVKLPWKPKDRELVWYVDADRKIRSVEFSDSNCRDLFLYKLGMLYRSLDGVKAHIETNNAYWDEIRKELEE